MRKLIVVLPVIKTVKQGNSSNAVLALKRALVIGNLNHTMSIAQLVGIYPA